MHTHTYMHIYVHTYMMAMKYVEYEIKCVCVLWNVDLFVILS